MKQSNFDKWLTTEPTQIGVWALIDEIATKQWFEKDLKICSCYGWNDETKRYDYTETCEVHHG
jgi:hypothetical protein